MLIPHFHTISLLLVAGVTSASCQSLPVIDLGKSVHQAQLNVSEQTPCRLSVT